MQGKTCDGGVVLHSEFYNAVTSGVLNAPQPSVFPRNDTRVPYVLVADDAFRELAIFSNHMLDR